MLLTMSILSQFQNTEKSKDWYKTMFKQIHRIPGKRVYCHFHSLYCCMLCFSVGVQALYMFLHVFVCNVTLCSVSPPLCSEPIEENPYRPTYIFPENYDIQMKSKGIRW